MSQDNSPIVKMLLENLTASLTQMVIKYESISKACDKIEERASEIISELRDVKEIKEIVNKIRSQCDQNLQITQGIIGALTELKNDLEELLADTAASHAVQSERLAAITAKLETVNSDMLRGFANIEAKVEDTRVKIAPVAKAARLISAPLGIVLFIIGFLAAAWLVNEIFTSTWTALSKRGNETGPAAVSVVNTNRVLGPGQGN